MPKKNKANKGSINPKLQRFTNFRQEHTDFVTLAYGHAGKAKILWYDLETLVTAGALHTAFKTPGTIFTMDWSLAKAQVMYVCIFLGSTTVGWFAIPENQGIDRVELEELAGYLNVFIPFILGLYISLCLQRWWALRLEGVGLVLDASQNVAILMSGMFRGPEWVELHDQILKWGLASVSLVVNACRGNLSLEALGTKGDNLLTEEELEVMNQAPYRARPHLLWCWTLMLCARICEDLDIAPGKYRDVAMECVSARNGIGLIWTYLNTQLPFAYVHLVTFLVNLNNLVVSVKCGMVLSIAIKASAWSQCVNQVLFVAIVPPLYQGLLGISHVIHDPFGEDLLDFPVMAFQEYSNESACVVYGSGWKCPGLYQMWGPTARLATEDAQDFDSGITLQPTMVKNVVRDEYRDTVQQMNQITMEELKSKDEIISMLREQCKGLESNITGMHDRIQNLESRTFLNAIDTIDSSVSASSGGWCGSPEVAKRNSPPPQPVFGVVK